MTNVFLSRMKNVGWPWLSRSVVSGSDRQSSRTRSRGVTRLTSQPAAREPAAGPLPLDEQRVLVRHVLGGAGQLTEHRLQPAHARGRVGGQVAREVERGR